MVTTEQDVRALFNRLNVNGDGLLSDLRTAVQEAVGSLLLASCNLGQLTRTKTGECPSIHPRGGRVLQSGALARVRE